MEYEIVERLRQDDRSGEVRLIGSQMVIVQSIRIEAEAEPGPDAEEDENGNVGADQALHIPEEEPA